MHHSLPRLALGRCIRRTPATPFLDSCTSRTLAPRTSRFCKLRIWHRFFWNLCIFHKQPQKTAAGKRHNRGLQCGNYCTDHNSPQQIAAQRNPYNRAQRTLECNSCSRCPCGACPHNADTLVCRPQGPNHHNRLQPRFHPDPDHQVNYPISLPSPPHKRTRLRGRAAAEIATPLWLSRRRD